MNCAVYVGDLMTRASGVLRVGYHVVQGQQRDQGRRVV